MASLVAPATSGVAHAPEISAAESFSQSSTRVEKPSAAPPAPQRGGADCVGERLRLRPFGVREPLRDRRRRGPSKEADVGDRGRVGLCARTRAACNAISWITLRGAP